MDKKAKTISGLAALVGTGGLMGTFLFAGLDGVTLVDLSPGLLISLIALVIAAALGEW